MNLKKIKDKISYLRNKETNITDLKDKKIKIILFFFSNMCFLYIF